jgi:tetratricopeptide (TPR) repeat protein
LGAGFISNPLNNLANVRAFKAFDRALELNPSDPIALQGKDNALMALGCNSDADAAFAKAKEIGYNGWFQLRTIYQNSALRAMRCAELPIRGAAIS